MAAVLKGENKIVLNRATVNGIMSEWLNTRAPNDPDVEVTDVYEEDGRFVVVTREIEEPANG